MTNSQLKTQIDTQITNETVKSGITPTDVGSNIKAVVDYADQQDALKVDKAAGERLINASEITKLSNTSGVNTGDQDLSGKQDVLVSGTNIKTVNGTSILGSGDIIISGGGLPYKVYTAFLQFVDASTIVSTVIQNTIGNGSKDGVNDIAWSYNSATQPRAVMTSAPFLIDKCVYVPTMYFQSNTAYALRGARASDSEFRLFSSQFATSTASLAFTSGVFVEIRVYN